MYSCIPKVLCSDGGRNNVHAQCYINPAARQLSLSIKSDNNTAATRNVDLQPTVYPWEGEIPSIILTQRRVTSNVSRYGEFYR